jgi:pimeloyl-ACP methyl ester carboxylesterase
LIASSKPLVVLVPGMGNTARLWSAQVSVLSRDAEVVVVDYVGAESTREMTDRVLAQVPDGRFSLVGFSLGATIALDLVGRAAERVERLAFISASPFADSDQAIKERQSLIAQAGKNYDAVLDGMSRFIVCPEGPLAGAARDTVVTMGQELGSVEFCRQQKAAMQRPDMRATLATIRCPVRILCGANDQVTPISGNRYIAEHISGATLEILDQSGHLLPLERPSEVNEFLLAWLNADRVG